MDQAALLENLKQLDSADFASLLFALNVLPAVLPGEQASQTERAIALIRLLNQQQRLHALEQQLRALRPFPDDETSPSAEPAHQLTRGMGKGGSDLAHKVGRFIDAYLEPGWLPFCGRSEDIRFLDHWLASPSEPARLLVVAPGGRGKSALLVRWCSQLAARSEMDVTFVPISRRAQMHEPRVVFASLAARLAHLAGEVPDPKVHLDADTARAWIARHLESTRQRSLVVVLDGLDEAGWKVDPSLFPARLGPKVRLIVSARPIAGVGPDDWLRRIGWQNLGAGVMKLERLGLDDVERVLGQMPAPVNRLARRSDIVAAIHDVTRGGESLTLWLLLQELAHSKVEDIDALRADDMRRRRPGIGGYFDDWWEEQVERQREGALTGSAVVLLRDLLAGALGPLSRDDLVELGGDVFVNSAVLDDALGRLDRLIFRSGRGDGYIWTHPDLGDYLWNDRLVDRERAQADQRYLNAGRSVSQQLASGTLAPSRASSYFVAHLREHLERAGAQDEAFLPLLHASRAEAWKTMDPVLAGFLDDVHRAGAAAATLNQSLITAGKQPPYVAEELRAVLYTATVMSRSDVLPSDMVVALVRRGVWTLEQAQPEIRRMDVSSRVAVLAELAVILTNPSLLAEARAIIDPLDGDERFNALSAVLPHIAGDYRQSVIDEMSVALDRRPWNGDRVYREAFFAIHRPEPRAVAEHLLPLVRENEHPRNRIYAMAALVPCFEEAPQRAALIDAVFQETRGNGLDPATSLHGIENSLGELGALLPQSMRQIVEIARSALSAQAIDALAPRLDGHELDRARQFAESILDNDMRAVAFAALSRRSGGGEFVGQVLALLDTGIQDPGRLWAISLLAPCLDRVQLEHVLGLLGVVDDVDAAISAAAALRPRDAHVLRGLLALARTIRYPSLRIKLFATLLPLLSGDEHGIAAGEILESMSNASIDHDATTKLSAAIPTLSAEQRRRLGALALMDAFDAEHGVTLLISLAESAASDEANQILMDALTLLGRLSGESRARAFEALLPMLLRMPAVGLDHVLALSEPWLPGDRAHALACVATRLSEPAARESLVERSLTALAQATADFDRHRTITILAPMISDNHWPHAFTLANEIQTALRQDTIIELTTGTGRFCEQLRHRILQDVSKTIGNQRDRALIFAQLAECAFSRERERLSRKALAAFEHVAPKVKNPLSGDVFVSTIVRRLARTLPANEIPRLAAAVRLIPERHLQQEAVLSLLPCLDEKAAEEMFVTLRQFFAEGNLDLRLYGRLAQWLARRPVGEAYTVLHSRLARSGQGTDASAHLVAGRRRQLLRELEALAPLLECVALPDAIAQVIVDVCTCLP